MKQDNTIKGNTKRQYNTTCYTSRQDNTIQIIIPCKTRKCIRPYQTKSDNASQHNTMPDKLRQYKTRQDNTIQYKTKQDNIRQ